jgi:signal transduction histidine kinase
VSSAHLRLLIVEDDEVDRLAIRRALVAHADVDVATDRETALRFVARQRYDAALVDYFLPPTTGLEVLSLLRGRQQDLPVIFLSGQGSEAVVLEAMKAGASDYLSKASLDEKDRLWRTVLSAVERNALRREAERNRARLELAVDAAGAGTWEIDLKSGQFHGDERFRRLLALPLAHSWPAAMVRERLTPEDAASLEGALAQGVVSLQLGLTGDPVRWIELRGRREPDLSAARMFGTALDVTQRKQTEIDAAQMRERLMGIASHDLKNPLGAVLQASTLLSRSPNLDEREKRFVKQIHASAERMAHLVVQLLDLTRVRLGGGLPLAKKPMRLDQAVRAVADELKLTTPERAFELKLDEVPLEADPDRIGQVASNLVGNAVKHSAPGGRVAVRVTREQADALLSVYNEGPAIPSERLEHIFEPFVVYGSAPRDGLGLGLYISREIVQAHGGSIRVASDAGGTRFTVRLPASAR